MKYSVVGLAAQTGVLLSLFVAGLALGIDADDQIRPGCASTSLWAKVKSSCTRRSCDRNAVSAFLASRTSCTDPEVGVALPAISAIATSLLAENAQGHSDGGSVSWASAREACKLADGLDCSQLQLEQMANGYVQK